jgi:hypothetical protein
MYIHPITTMYVDMEKEMCRICMCVCDEPAPCACKDYVHQECLQEWLAVSQRTTCEICRTPLDVAIEIESETESESETETVETADDIASAGIIVGIMIGILVCVITACLTLDFWTLLICVCMPAYTLIGCLSLLFQNRVRFANVVILTLSIILLIQYSIDIFREQAQPATLQLLFVQIGITAALAPFSLPRTPPTPPPTPPPPPTSPPISI